MVFLPEILIMSLARLLIDISCELPRFIGSGYGYVSIRSISPLARSST